MIIDTLSTFPSMYESVMGSSMMKRAQEKGLLQFFAHDLRDWTHDRHRTTDDYPYGGGCGLVMKCEPIFEAVESILDIKPGSLRSTQNETGEWERADGLPDDVCIVFMSPSGRRFDDELASELASKDRLLFICGHYEGIDERAYCLADEIISLGDYVLTSGELASMVVIDAAVRKIPGVLGAQNGAESESFVDGMIEHPQYTRPADFRGMRVPEVLLSGHHLNISKWQRQMSILRTLRSRPDLIEALLDDERCAGLDSDDLDFLETCLNGKLSG